MKKPPDDVYFEWLYSLVSNVRLRDPSKTHWVILRQLYKKEFVWIIPNDDNRIEDGLDLRYEFIHVSDVVQVDPDWFHLQCSFLEVLIGLARRLAFDIDASAKFCFWELIKNLNLEMYHDAAFSAGIESLIDETADRVIWRTYNRTGQGGLFPLRNPRKDQRKTELWYQLNAYVLERE